MRVSETGVLCGIFGNTKNIKLQKIVRPTIPPIQQVQGILSSGTSGQNVTLTTHLHVVSRLRMSGDIPLRLCALMVLTGKPLPSHFD
jgi:hypothetical protein